MCITAPRAPRVPRTSRAPRGRVLRHVVFAAGAFLTGAQVS